MGDGPLLRLTVGPLKLLCLYEDGEEVRLRLASLPLELATDVGVLNVEEDWLKREIELPDDSTKTFEGEKVLRTCPDVGTALGLLMQRPIMTSLRMLAAGRSTKNFPFQRKYRPKLAAKAWLAAEPLIDGSAFVNLAASVATFRPAVCGCVHTRFPARPTSLRRGRGRVPVRRQ